MITVKWFTGKNLIVFMVMYIIMIIVRKAIVTLMTVTDTLVNSRYYFLVKNLNPCSVKKKCPSSDLFILFV